MKYNQYYFFMIVVLLVSIDTMCIFECKLLLLTYLDKVNYFTLQLIIAASII